MRYDKRLRTQNIELNVYEIYFLVNMRKLLIRNLDNMDKEFIDL